MLLYINLLRDFPSSVCFSFSRINHSEIFIVHDYKYCDDALTSKIRNYGSSISMRSNGASTLSYNSNGYYLLTTTTNNSQSIIPIDVLTGLNDVVVEFDAYVESGSTPTVGFGIYFDSSNWYDFTSQGWKEQYAHYMENGTFHQSSKNITTYTSTWLHHKYTISDTTFSFEVYNGNTLVYSGTQTIPSTTSTTKLGFVLGYTSNVKARYKNIICKSL